VVGNQIRGDFSLEFARRYTDDGLLEDGRSLLIIRAAVGGTGFSDKQWGLEDYLYLQMMEMTKTALNMNSDNRLIAFLWHQGEPEAGNGIDFDTHYNNLSTLVKTVRDEFGVTDLPFIAGDFVQLWKQNNIEICTPIVKAIRAVCELLRHTAFVETCGLKSNFEEYGAEADGGEDEIHFSRAALYELGDRYYCAYREIIS
jgi:hypothetical protein